jgi:hypothetical protein
MHQLLLNAEESCEVDERGDIISCNLCAVAYIPSEQDQGQKPEYKVYKISAKITEVFHITLRESN